MPLSRPLVSVAALLVSSCVVEPSPAALAPSRAREVEGSPGFVIGPPFSLYGDFGAVLLSGDLDGDGFEDLLVTHPSDNALTTYLGSASGLSTSWASGVIGPGGTDFGVSAALGDVDGDGDPDLVTGAPGEFAGDGLVLESENDGAGAFNQRVQLGGPSGGRLGVAVALVDADADGHADLVAGAPEANGAEGAVFVYPGSPAGVAASPTVTLAGGASGDRLGSSIADAGDANGDGYGDVLVCAYGGAYCRVYTGSATGIDGATFTTLDSPGLDGFGVALGAVDVDADGFDEVVVGAPTFNGSTGRVYVFHGTASGPDGATPFVLQLDPLIGFGASFAAVGDLDGDGIGDLLIGAQNAGYLMRGTGGGIDPTPIAELRGPAQDGTFRAGPALDVDGDGHREPLGAEWLTNGGHVYGFLSYDDADGDGWPAGGSSTDQDCDDANAAIGLPTPFYVDDDGDGYGNSNLVVSACTAPTGTTSQPGDCDDAEGDVHPGAVEICDGLDDDCDGDTDGGLLTPYYADVDGDGFGDPASSVSACSLPSGYSGNATDCDDASATVNPGAAEICDLVDNDCDAAIDEDGLSTWYADADHDGYGDDGSSIEGCGDPADGYTLDATDCDDANGEVYPDARERCNGIDDDCDAAVDEDVMDTYYTDADGDGFGDPSAPLQACDASEGVVANATDCDDADATVSPGGAEILDDGIDQDCSGADARTPEVPDEKGCGCDAGSGGGGVGAMLVALAMVARRRR